MKTELFNRLPTDIIIYISSYFDNIFYYKNKFININKIDKNNKCYELIKLIKKPIVHLISTKIHINYFLYRENTNIGFQVISIYDLNLQNTYYKITKVIIGKIRGAYREYLHNESVHYNIINKTRH